MPSVLIANEKGGCGKTTFATTLASALARISDRVALADADRQRSSLTWLGRRPNTAPRIAALDWSRRADIGSFPAQLRRKSIEWLVIDAPGAIRGAKAEALVSEADIIITPITPSFFDAHSTFRFLSRIENLKRIRRGGAEFFIAVNRVPRPGRHSEELDRFFLRIEREPAAEITERAAYPDLAAQGLGLFDRRVSGLLKAQSQWTPLLRLIGAGRASAI